MTISRRQRGRSAFTLIEMTMALAMAMGIVFAILAMLQQQISFNQALADFRFLRDEAPQLNTLLTNIVNKADSYRIYTNLSDAKNQTGAVRSDGRAMKLRFRNPDGTSDQAIVSFEVLNGKKQLNFYYKNRSSISWPTNPSWTISSKPDGVDFDNTTGILLVTLAGSKGDEITYAGNPD